MKAAPAGFRSRRRADFRWGLSAWLKHVLMLCCWISRSPIQGLDTLVRLHEAAKDVPSDVEDETLGVRLIQAGAQD